MADPNYNVFGRETNPLALAWGALPSNVRAAYASAPNALAELSPGAAIRDTVAASGDLARNVLAGNGWGAAGAGAGMLTAMAGLVPGGRVFSSRKTADALEGLLKRHGVEIERQGSGLSDSQYLNAQRWDAATEQYSDPLKVRLSSHEAKPTYERLNGAADYEIGEHSMSHTSDAHDAAGMILRRLGIEPDKRLSTILQRQTAEREAEMAAKKSFEEEQRARNLASWADTQKIDNALAARGHDRSTMSGKDWRELRYKFRRETP